MISHFFVKIFQTPDAEVIILLLQLSSQNKNTRVLVFFKILVHPITSSPSFEAPINFKSNDIVTQGTFPAALCAAVPDPASIKAES